MLTIHVQLWHDLFRGAPADDLALTGEADRAEWPPSPARLFAALVAGGGTGSTPRHGTTGLALMEHADPPTIRAVAYADAIHNRLEPRFVVIDETSKKKANKEPSGAVQNYPVRRAQEIRPGVRVAPKVSRVAYVWPELKPTSAELEALSHRAARVGYLGCSDSPARVWVGTALDAIEEMLPAWVPIAPGDCVLPVPYAGFLEALDVAFHDWTEGRPMRRAWIPSELADYRSPEYGQRSELRPHLIWLRFDRPVRGQRVLHVAEAIRNAVLARYSEVNGAGNAETPEVLTGHVSVQRRGYQHVHWLPLPAVGHPHADGRIRGACIWLPPDTETSVIEAVRRAVSGAWTLRALRVDVRPFDGTERPWASNPKRWERPSRFFVSAFPAVHERWTKRRLDLAEISRWCEHAGVPAPVAARVAEVPLLRGASTLASHQVFRDGAERRPFSHVALVFPEPVSGPFALGRGRQFGLGLMVPVAEHDLP